MKKQQEVIRLLYIVYTMHYQGGHVLADMKFPVFSCVFPVLQKFSLCFLLKN